MDKRSTTIALLVLIVFLGLFLTGRAQKIWAAVFGPTPAPAKKAAR